MSKQMPFSKTPAIRSGIGDKDDLFVKKPNHEKAKESFRYAARLRGRKRKEALVYPEIPFEYSIRYKGKQKETYNEAPYRFDIEAHPKRCLSYDIRERRYLCYERLWEAKAKFEAKVKKMTLEYALTYEVTRKVKDQRKACWYLEWEANVAKSETMEYAVHWSADYQDNPLQAFTYDENRYIGEATSDTPYVLVNNNTTLVDNTNSKTMSGMLADSSFLTENDYSITVEFRPILNNSGISNVDEYYRTSTNQTSNIQVRPFQAEGTGGFDDDLIGFIFRADSKDDFYVFLWEAEHLHVGGTRAALLDGFTLGEDHFAYYDEANHQVIHSPYSIENDPYNTQDAKDDYYFNQGWGTMHKRVYRVSNGVFQELDTSQMSLSGSGQGWVMEDWHNVEISTQGTTTTIVCGDGDVITVNTHNEIGTFGVCNMSQAVEFRNLSSPQMGSAQGRVPETGWDTCSDPYTIDSVEDHIEQSVNHVLADQGLDPNSVALDNWNIWVEINNGSGSANPNRNISLSGSISLYPSSLSTTLSGRIPETGCNTVTQTPEEIITEDVEQFIKQSSSLQNALSQYGSEFTEQDVTFTSIKAQVDNTDNGEIQNDWRTYNRENARVKVISYDKTRKETTSGRIPQDGSWFAFDGIGDYTHAENVGQWINQEGNPDFDVTGDDVIDIQIKGILSSSSQNEQAGKIYSISSIHDSFRVHNNNPEDAGEIYKEEFYKCDTVTICPDNQNLETGVIAISNIKKLFEEEYKTFFNRNDFIEIKDTYELIKPEKIIKDTPSSIENEPESESSTTGECVVDNPVLDEDHESEEEKEEACTIDFDWDGIRLVMWTCEPPVKYTTKTFEACVYAYENDMFFEPLTSFPEPNEWTSYELIPNEATIESYDLLKWEGHQKKKWIEPDTRIHAKTIRWFQATWDMENYINQGVANSESLIDQPLPPVPEHYIDPKTKERMSNAYSDVHFVLRSKDAYKENSEIVLWFNHNPEKTTENTDVLITTQATDRIIIKCKENPRWIDWESGEYRQKGKVNGRPPLYQEGAGKEDMNGVRANVVEFPENLDPSTIEGPFIRIYDPESPKDPRIHYRINDNQTIDFYSDYQSMHVWYEDWQSEWKEDPNEYQISQSLSIAQTPTLDPTDPALSSDYNQDDTFIDSIETTTNNPFVDTWAEQMQKTQQGLHATYYGSQGNQLFAYVDHTQYDFAEDQPINNTNPNYQDPSYEGTLCFKWGTDSPIKGQTTEPFSVIWKGYLYIPKSGNYNFETQASDGVRVWINHEKIIDEWHENLYFTRYYGSINLKGNTWVPIEIHYYDQHGASLFRLRWSQPNKDYQRIHPMYLSPYLDYIVHAKLKEEYPLPWHPLIHNGYYYHQEQEYYLYAQKEEEIVTPVIENNKPVIYLSQVPQQGSPIIVKDNQGNPLRKVTFYDDDWDLTLEHKEEFNGNGHDSYYLQYKGIDIKTLSVLVNNLSISYTFDEDESCIHFNQILTPKDKITVRYKLLYSFYVNMHQNPVQIVLHDNYDISNMTKMTVIYESAEDTPYYQATECIVNPLLNHNHTGFLYITNHEEQKIKKLLLHVSPQIIENKPDRKVTITALLIDENENPIPQKEIVFYRDKKEIARKITNDAGEAYVYDEPTNPSGAPGKLISEYEAICEDHQATTLLNYHQDQKETRYIVELQKSKSILMGGVDDELLITAIVRDEYWQPVKTGNIIVYIKHTDGNESNTPRTIDPSGKTQIVLNGQSEKHGKIRIKVSYDMGDEIAANLIHVKVIGQ